MKIFAVRLLPGQDLKTELINITKEQKIQAGVVLSAVGSVTKARLRMADERIVKDFNEKLEIVSMTGTLCQDDVHIHASFGNSEGRVVGGHLKEGCNVFVTAEIVIGILDNYTFRRELDSSTGFSELVIEPK